MLFVRSSSDRDRSLSDQARAATNLPRVGFSGRRATPKSAKHGLRA